LISFIIPIKNRAHWLVETVDSLLSQTNKSWEAIVIDDRSNSDEFEIIKKVCNKDIRIKLFQNESGIHGAPYCRNLGVQKSVFERIVFLDSDDILDKNFVSTRQKIIEEFPHFDMLIFPVITFVNVPGDHKLLWNIFNENNDLDRFLNADIVWQTTSPIWKKDAFHRIGGFDESLISWQDWEIHTRALVLNLTYKKFDITPDIFYRIDRENSINKNRNEPSHIVNRINAFFKIYYLGLKHNVLNKKRKYLLAKLMFNNAILLSNKNPEKAKDTFSFIIEKKLIINWELKVWLYRSKKKSTNLVNKFIDYIIYIKHKDHFQNTKTTYFNVYAD
jgi:glycosyltransferase involved in cell wall biosynthesis